MSEARTKRIQVIIFYVISILYIYLWLQITIIVCLHTVRTVRTSQHDPDKTVVSMFFYNSTHALCRINVDYKLKNCISDNTNILSVEDLLNSSRNQLRRLGPGSAVSLPQVTVWSVACKA